MAIVAIGPLSNVTALLTMHPGERKKIRRIVLMGGSIAHGYYPNSEPTAEYNIAADAKASRVVFTSGVPIGLTSMEGLVRPLQTALSSDNQLWAPLLLRNNTGAAENIAIHSDLPAGGAGKRRIASILWLRAASIRRNSSTPRLRGRGSSRRRH